MAIARAYHPAPTPRLALLLAGALLGFGGPTGDDEAGMTLVEHLTELRARLIKAVLAVAAGAAIAYLNVGTLLGLLLRPTGLTSVVVPDPTGGLMLTFQIALSAGLALASPVVLYQAIAFVLPAMTARERRVFFGALPLVVVCLAAGLLFGYVVVLPFSLSYLLSYGAGGYFDYRIQAGPLIDFVTALLLGFGLAFELPVVLLILTRLGLVTAGRLASLRRYALLASFVVAAVITPTPDPLNQALVALPLYLLYESGILLSRLR
jgi:sec-independent protein translocase protein TatC